MNQATLAWAAFRNMLRKAASDPVWAIINIVISPFRAVVYFYQVGLVFLVVALILAAIPFAIPEAWFVSRWIANIVVAIVILIFAFRLLTNPMIEHFGDLDGDTHGTARFATNKEVAPLTRNSSGLLIGRDRKNGKLLRYDGPAHLLTMAPTRTGKGVGTIIPNLLTADRSVICIDPKGENARIAGRARRKFGQVYVIDPFSATAEPMAAFNPLEGLDPDGLDVAEDASTLADALVFDEPGMAGEAHWNEEAKALIGGMILHIVAHETASRRSLVTLRENLTLAPEAFTGLMKEMQDSTAAGGLVARAANRHLGKSDREAAGVLSAAQRHTHFLDSPRMARVLGRSDFRFADLKSRTADG